MADAPPPGKGGGPKPGGASPPAKPPGGGPPPAGAAAAAQPNMQQIFMLAGRGMTPQMQQLFQNFRPPPMPPELADAFRKMQPQLEAARAEVLKPEVAADMKRYQAAVAKLNPSSPDFAAQLEKIPKPNLQSLRLPEPSPEIRRMIQQWLLSAKSPQIAAALGQAAQTQPSPNQPPKPAAKQQQGKQAGQQQPAAQQQAAIKQEQQQQSAGKPPAAKPPAGKPPAPPSKQPSPGPQAVVPQRARPRKPSPLGPLGSKPAAPATATPGGPAAGGAGSTHVTPAGAGIKPAASSEEADGGGEATGIEVEVVCNGLKGTFLVDQQLMVCFCPACEERAEREGRRRTIVSPSEFERHAGAGQAKKWRWTVHTADDKQTLGDWLAANNLDTRSKLGRSPFSTKQRKQAAEAADAEAEGREEAEGPRLHLSGRSLPVRRGRGKRKKSEEPDTDEDAELQAVLESLSDEEGGPDAPQRQKQRRIEPEPEAQQAQQVQQAQRMDVDQAELAVSPLAPRPGGSGHHGGGASSGGGVGGGAPGQLQPSGGSGKHKRQLRWIRRSTASPEGSENEGEGQDGKRQQREEQAQVKQEPGTDGEQEQDGPLLLPMRYAAEAAEAAAARPAAGAGSAVGPRPLGLPPVVVPRKGGKGGRNGGEEPPGLRSPTGKPWMAADHAFHEEHEGTDMRLGEAYQARLPDYYGPLELLGEAAEAQEPIAALPGPSEAEALASAGGPEREQAASMPRDATADLWLREVADQVRATITGRQQRQRKQSRWLQETFDPNAVLGGKPLVERQFEEDNARDRFMLGRTSQRGGGLLQELDAAVAAGAQPELLRWSVERVGDSGAGLGVRLSLGGVLFSGVLAPMGGTASGGVTAHHRPLSVLLGEAAVVAAAGGTDERAATRGLQPAVSGISSEQPAGSRRAGQGTPAATGGVSLGATGGRAAAAHASQWHEGESRHDAGAERRQQAEARFQAMEAAGAPLGTKCALCHGTEVDEIDESSRGLGGRSPSGLGQMILVRVSAVSHAWVHDQCARWSPEVYDPEGTGHLEGVRDAVRRGRMLRCKYCGDKGATLGCFKLTCRASYHLACARKYKCMLQVDPYVVACPEHVNDLPAPYGNKPAKSRSGKRKPGVASGAGRGRGRGAGGAAGGAKGRGGRGSRGSDSEEEEAVLEGMEESEEEEEMQDEDEDDEGSQAGSEPPTGVGEESDSAAALLTELQALADRADNGRKAVATTRQAPAALPLPIPVVPGAAPGGAWTRERIVERHDLHDELAAEQAHGTKAVVVNFEETHFRFRSFHSAEDITKAVQDDADAILVLDRSLVPASQAWPHAYAFTSQAPAEQLASFTTLLIKEGFKRLPAEEQQRQLKQTAEQVARQQQGAAAAAAPPGQPPAPATGVSLPAGVNPAAVAAGLAQALANPAGRAAIAARLAELAPSIAARPAAAGGSVPAVATATLSQAAPALLSSILQQRGQAAPQGQQQQQQQQQPKT